MSRTFGAVRQIAFVVPAIDAAMAHWSSLMGVGSFHVKRRIMFDPYIYRGEKRESPEVSIALANTGALQVELIERHCDRASVYREFLDAGGRGLQHVAAWHDRAGFDAVRARLLEAGLTIVQECVITASGVRLCYFDTGTPDAPVFELADLDEPTQRARLEGIRNAAVGWDGTLPVVEVGV
jgi:hypothetical protein